MEREILLEHEASVNQIRDWVQDYPELGEEIMWNNPVHLFSRCVEGVPVHKGPLGTPIWLEKGEQGR